MSKISKQSKKKTPVNWSNLAETLSSSKKEEKIVDNWEELLDEHPKENSKEYPKEHSKEYPKEHPKEHSKECLKKEIYESNLEKYEIPNDLSWEDKQSLLMTLDEEEAKKSPYYRDDFEKMDLEESIVHGIYSYGFDKPSRVQCRAIKALMTGKDCIVQAQSGTGKTATFVIGTLSNINRSLENTQALIIAPTRELADQIYKVLQSLSQYTGITSVLCCGQMKVEDKIRNAQIIIGTTGRIIDCIGRGQINTKHIKMLVLDEADEMVSEGFKEQVDEIRNKIQNKYQVCLFSATLSSEVMEYVNSITNEPIQILIRQEFVTLKGISQFYINCIKEDYKLETLIDIYKRYMCTQSIIYVNSKNKCCWLASELIKNNYTVLYIDSSMTQSERSRIMKEFRNGTCRILVSTNLLSRGIDVQGVNLVINYDLPNVNNIESYVHRIGRCGRYGRKGAAINFITPNDYYIIQNIKKFYSTEINELPEDISGSMTF